MWKRLLSIPSKYLVRKLPAPSPVSHEGRNYGLDVIRAVAISCVLVTHAAVFLIGTTNTQWLALFGFIGVELFFGLSGYLIGSILLKRRHPLNRFYLHRLAKILPPYLLVLVALLLTSPLMGWNEFLTHALFLQDFDPAQAEVFPVSWSLAIEFWFYMFVPLVFLRARSEHSLLIRLILLISAILVLRLIAGWLFQPLWEFGVHRFVPLRFDALLFGVLAAVIESRYHGLHQHLSRRAVAALAVYLVGVVSVWFGVMFVNYASFEASTVTKAVLPSLTGIIVMALVLGAKRQLAGALHTPSPWLRRLVVWLSQISYSLYLVHLFIFQFFASLPGPKASWYVVAVAVSLLVSWLMFELFEVRVVVHWRKKLEQRWWPTAGTSASGR